MAWVRDWMDTFLRYPMGSIASLGKWTTASGGTPWTAADGMQGLACSQASKTILGSTQGRIVGLRCRTGSNTGAGHLNIVTLRDSAAGNPLRLDYNTLDGTLRLFLPGGGFFNSTDPIGQIPNDTEANFSVAVFFDGALAHYEVRVNNVVVPDMVGTQAVVASPQMSYIGVGDGPTTSNSDYVWIWTKTYSGSGWGGAFVDADYYGNVLRGVIVPDEDGQYPAVQVGARFLPSGGSTKYFDRMNEALADSDTTYASNIVDPAGAPGSVDRMSVTLTDPPATLVNVKAVQRCTLWKMQSGSGTAKRFFGVSGSAGDTYDAEGTLTVPSSYQYALSNPEVDPRDAVAWNRAKLVNLDLGVELFDLV
jgi:hypothetical protein